MSNLWYYIICTVASSITAFAIIFTALKYRKTVILEITTDFSSIMSELRLVLGLELSCDFDFMKTFRNYLSENPRLEFTSCEYKKIFKDYDVRHEIHEKLNFTRKDNPSVEQKRLLERYELLAGEQLPKGDTLVSKYLFSQSKTMDSLEVICMRLSSSSFISRLFVDKFIFSSIHLAFLNFVEIAYSRMANTNTCPDKKYFAYTKKLYNRWKNRTLTKS